MLFAGTYQHRRVHFFHHCRLSCNPILLEGNRARAFQVTF
jgi:hypothetical protein